MVTKLIIATKNRSKYQSIKTLIRLVVPDLRINISQISSKIPSAVENGNSAYENSLIKAKHYKNYLKHPYIVVDDNIKFGNDKNTIFAHNYHKLGGGSDIDTRKLLLFIQKFLMDTKPTTMVRTRYFVFAKDGQYQRISSKFTSSLEPLNKADFYKLKDKKLLDNPLNYFAIPKSDAKRLWKYKTKDRTFLVYDDVIKKKISTLLKSLAKK